MRAMGETGRVQLVATDLDGTVVGRDGTISERTLAALRACEEAGVHVVFVTGRPPRWMQPVALATGHQGTAICANGAIVYDLREERVVRARTLTVHDVIEVVARVRQAIGPVAVALETLEGFVREPGYATPWGVVSDGPVGELEELLAQAPSVVKVLLRQQSNNGDDMLAATRPLLAGLAQPTHSNVADCLLEVSALGVSKAATLAEVADERGVTAAGVVAFGDMPNDREMLAWAGRGYAMADGHAEAIAAADEVAPPCAEDGVAQVLERLLGEQAGETLSETAARPAQPPSPRPPDRPAVRPGR